MPYNPLAPQSDDDPFSRNRFLFACMTNSRWLMRGDAAALLLVPIFPIKQQHVVCAVFLSAPNVGHFYTKSIHRGTAGLSLDGLPHQQQMFGTATLFFAFCLHLCMVCCCNCSPAFGAACKVWRAENS